MRLVFKGVEEGTTRLVESEVACFGNRSEPSANGYRGQWRLKMACAKLLQAILQAKFFRSALEPLSRADDDWDLLAPPRQPMPACRLFVLPESLLLRISHASSPTPVRIVAAQSIWCLVLSNSLSLISPLTLTLIPGR